MVKPIKHVFKGITPLDQYPTGDEIAVMEWSYSVSRYGNPRLEGKML